MASFGASWVSYLWAKPSQRNLQVWRIIEITVRDEAITNQKDQGRRCRTLDPVPASGLDACVSACVCVCVYCPCGSAAHIGDCSTTGCNEKWLASVSAHSKYLYHFRKQPNTPSWIGSVTFLCSQEMLTGASQLWQFLADWSCACTEVEVYLGTTL